MDYSQFQVKYIDNPVLESGKAPDIVHMEIPDYSNISYLNGEASPATALIEETPEETQEIPRPNPVRKAVATQPRIKMPDLKPSQRLNAFNLYYDQAMKQDTTGQLAVRRNLLTRLAYYESGFRHDVSNGQGAPAFGYFQFMQGNYRGKNYNNVGQYAGVDIDTFKNSPVLQIQAANNLANYFMRSFSKTELQRLHQMGWTDNAIIAGAWLGGPGGVRAFAFQGKDRSDGATTVGQRMKQFNYAN